MINACFLKLGFPRETINLTGSTFKFPMACVIFTAL